MDFHEFRRSGYEMVDYIADYVESLPLKSLTPTENVGFLKSAFPTPPEKGESFDKIMEDVEKYIMPGITHLQHPGFHAFFPSNSSFPAILAVMFADTLGYVGFDWNLRPAGSELEAIILDWYGKLIGLPNDFLRYSKSSRGAAQVARSTSECLFLCMATAQRFALGRLQDRNPSVSYAALLSTLVAYCSKELESWIVKSARFASVTVKTLETGEDFRLRGETLMNAITLDKRSGLTPFFVCTTLGSMCGACDPIDEIGPVCKKYGIWLHINATYAGTALICPEYKHFLKGIEYAKSFNVSPSKWMLVHVDCAVLFVKDRFKLIESVSVDRTQTGYSFAEKDWSYPSRCEFRALKLWFVMRMYGVEGLQKHIRNHVQLAELFEECVKRDERFEVVTCNFGLVCFRLIGSDELNKCLLAAVNSSSNIFITPCRMKNRFILRFVVCTERANEKDITYAWSIICKYTEEVLKKQEILEKKAIWEQFMSEYRFGLP